jgi:hypothetical protein
MVYENGFCVVLRQRTLSYPSHFGKIGLFSYLPILHCKIYSITKPNDIKIKELDLALIDGD